MLEYLQNEAMSEFVIFCVFPKTMLNTLHLQWRGGANRNHDQGLQIGVGGGSGRDGGYLREASSIDKFEKWKSWKQAKQEQNRNNRQNNKLEQHDKQNKQENMQNIKTKNKKTESLPRLPDEELLCGPMVEQFFFGFALDEVW